MSADKPRVATASLMHESNSFNPVVTSLSDFRILPRSVNEWSNSNTAYCPINHVFSPSPSHVLMAQAFVASINDDRMETAVEPEKKRLQVAGGKPNGWNTARALAATHFEARGEGMLRPPCYSLAFSLGLFSAMKARMFSASPSSFSHCS